MVFRWSVELDKKETGRYCLEKEKARKPGLSVKVIFLEQLYVLVCVSFLHFPVHSGQPP